MVLYLDEIEGYSSLREPVADRVSVAPAGEACSQNRNAEGSQASGHVYPLAARERDAFGRPVAVAEGQAGDNQRPVDGGVQGDGQDHCPSSTLLIFAKIPRLYTTPSGKLVLP